MSSRQGGPGKKPRENIHLYPKNGTGDGGGRWGTAGDSGGHRWQLSSCVYSSKCIHIAVPGLEVLTGSEVFPVKGPEAVYVIGKGKD